MSLVLILLLLLRLLLILIRYRDGDKVLDWRRLVLPFLLLFLSVCMCLHPGFGGKGTDNHWHAPTHHLFLSVQ